MGKPGSILSDREESEKLRSPELREGEELNPFLWLTCFMNEVIQRDHSDFCLTNHCRA